MKLIFIIPTLLFICLSMNAQTFTPGEYGGLKYQALASCINEDIRPALVIFLHGGHARGDDNQSQIDLPAVQDIATYIVDNRIPAHFLVPQCPADHEWIYNNGVSGCKEKVMNLISEYITSNNINEERVYLCSVSMGSWAAWHILKEYPDLFAAAFIASGRPRYLYAHELVGTPLYVTVGSRERSMEPIRLFAIDIEKAGGTVRFDPLSGQDHRQACTRAFSNKRLKWLFAQRRISE